MNPQIEALQRRVGGYPIELPAAALMAGAVLLATIALPDWRFEAAVAATVVLFAAATWAASGVGLPRPVWSAEAGWHGELLVAVRLVGGDPRLRRLLAVLMVDNLLYGYIVVLIVLLGTGPGSTTDSLGYLNTAFTADGRVPAISIVVPPR